MPVRDYTQFAVFQKVRRFKGNQSDITALDASAYLAVMSTTVRMRKRMPGRDGDLEGLRDVLPASPGILRRYSAFPMVSAMLFVRCGSVQYEDSSHAGMVLLSCKQIVPWTPLRVDKGKARLQFRMELRR